MENQTLGQLLTDLFLPGTSLVEKIVRPIAVYIFLVAILRVGGRRELGQLNAFDLVVLLTLSNAVQNAIIGDDNSLIGGMIGGATLVLLNLGVVRFLYHHRSLERRISGEPVLLVKDGRLIRENLAHELITEEELQAAIRRQGVDHIEGCAEVILETSGVVTVLARQPTPDELMLTEVVSRLDRIERLLSERSLGPSPDSAKP
jgi:uncharacterized membrane protein YcaP (DUF421 family)